MHARLSIVTLLVVACLACAPSPGGDPSLPDASSDLSDDVEAVDSRAEVGGDVVEDTEDTAGIPVCPDPGQDSDGDGLDDHQECELGTDSHAADSDGDGKSDGVEITEGTDPREIASASSWFPDRLRTRPRLFFGPEDLAALRQQLETPSAAEAVLLTRLRERAALEPPAHPIDDPYDRTIPPRRAEIAEARAFLALLEGDGDAAASAAEILAAPFPDPYDLDVFSGYDLSESEAMVSACTAYDLLAAHPELPAGVLQRAESRLRERVEVFRDMCLNGPLLYMVSLARNNHTMKVQGALGLCALTLNDEPRSVRNLHEAVTGLYTLLEEFQGTAGGGYAEGYNYLSYGANTWLPFLVAYHRFARGDALTYRVLGESVFPNPHEGELMEVGDFADSERLRSIFERALFATMPDGRTPPLDDANPSWLHGGLLAWFFGDPRFKWNWEKSHYYAARGDVASFALAGPDAAEAPDWGPDGFFPEAGWALLRDDLSATARYFLVTGEHGAPRTNGLGHEQPDGTSFMLTAFGDDLILDPGYINWDNRELVATPLDHNVVLVDGQGARVSTILDVGRDVFLEGWEADLDRTTFTARARVRGVNIVRRFLRLRGDVFVVADQLDAEDSHVYTLLLHGKGGGTLGPGTFERLEGGARWLGPHARVEAWVTPTEGQPEIEEHQEEHQEGWGHYGFHVALATTAEASQRAGFLTVLVARRTEDETPAVAISRPAEGVVVVHLANDTLVFNRRDEALELEGGLDAPVGLTHTAPDMPSHTWPPSDVQ